MRKLIKVLFTAVLSILCSQISAYKPISKKGKKSENVDQSTKAAGCSPATGLTNLEFNNVRALIETGGSLWQDRAQGRASYFIPASGNLSVLYSGSIWIGGKQGFSGGNLALAGVRYRQDGDDFWPGPLRTGTAEVDESTCEEYDRFYELIREDAVQHRAYHEAKAAGEDLSDLFPNGYQTPDYFSDDIYPAIGESGESHYLAPFYDFDGDGDYDPEEGDYPGFDVQGEIDCRALSREDPVPLFGDVCYYWIFNDKGNIHTETGGPGIGIEIRAQAFAFATADEINNMTFYNYQIINQGTTTLFETYFGKYADPDVGTATDDYVGCDVQRGLGYAYNGLAIDEPSVSSPGYGAFPPAVGIDFFEGPYQDDDGQDNPINTEASNSDLSSGIPYKGLGLGYGDGIVDNERYGMKKFVYYNNSTNESMNDPDTYADHYNYLIGKWKDGTPMKYGGTGYSQDGIEADYMFPFDSDIHNYGTGGVAVEPWYEEGEDNDEGDRRFIQSAGPFTLEPGEWNNITVGVVYARSTSGSPFSSVQKLFTADDKAQALFDNCFEIVEGPTAPDLTIQEMDNKLLFALTNDGVATNNRDEIAYDENLTGFDPIIPESEEGIVRDSIERSYLFQGYIVYQLLDDKVSPTELNDLDKARPVFQCDIRDSITSVYNFESEDDIPFPVPVPKVHGANEGISHSFEITSDAFAQGDGALVNHKTYYFMPIAYSYNNYQDFDPNTNAGQATQFLSSRKSSSGALKVYSAIPHKISPEAGGTIVSASYGDGVEITRHEGKGNGMNDLELTRDSELKILRENYAETITYKAGKGPVNIKVIDPIRLKNTDFELKLISENGSASYKDDEVYWQLIEKNNLDTITSNKAFKYLDEYILLDYGISITFNHYEFEDPDLIEEFHLRYTDVIGGTKEYEDPNKDWLIGIVDQEGFQDANWIRSGNVVAGEDAPDEEIPYNDANVTQLIDATPIDVFFDINNNYEDLVGGTWSPFCLTAMSMNVTVNGINLTLPSSSPRDDLYIGKYDWTNSTGDSFSNNVIGLNNVDVVFTSDTSKWTRCGVLEMQAIPELTNTGEAEKMRLRQSPSVDKLGRSAGEPGFNERDGTLNGEQPTGMGWFPGYAIDVGTGERLNMCFGEDSWLISENGADMIFNPTSNQYVSFNPHFGGQHWIYVFKNDRYELDDPSYMPTYDQGQYIYDALEGNFSNGNQRKVFASCSWVGSSLTNEEVPMLSIEEGLIPTETRIKLRVAEKYDRYSPTSPDVEDTSLSENNWNPYYTFSTDAVQASFNNDYVMEEVLECINVVPNPYYAYSQYENNKLDHRVKVTNLPEECVVSIYNVSGTLVRQFKKANATTSLDWDLKNQTNIPIAGGVYLIHVNVPGIGERIIKWFGVIRPADFDNF